VLRRLRAGEVVNCFKLNTADARIAEIAALAGFDSLWSCVEHIANDWSVIEQHIWAAKAYDVDVIVRVARGNYSDYVRPLELDAAGIMVSHLMGLEDARTVVRMTRFHPLGRRAAATARTWWEGSPSQLQPRWLRITVTSGNSSAQGTKSSGREFASPLWLMMTARWQAADSKMASACSQMG
jgi:2-keto-3-deoxy-L-rhamnonate aldolase RhmA